MNVQTAVMATTTTTTVLASPACVAASPTISDPTMPTASPTVRGIRMPTSRSSSNTTSIMTISKNGSSGIPSRDSRRMAVTASGSSSGPYLSTAMYIAGK